MNVAGGPMDNFGGRFPAVYLSRSLLAKWSLSMSKSLDFQIIDSHQHFVYRERYEYYWMRSMPPALHRSFTPEMLSNELAEIGVGATVVVQAVPSPEETYALVEAARRFPFVRAVVASIDLTDPNIKQSLDSYRAHTIIRAVRHQKAEDSEADWFLRPEVMRGFAAVEESGLACDLLCRSHQLHTVRRIAEAFPSLRILLEHAGKPAIQEGGYETWTESIGELATKENVCCKLSELIPQADWDKWTSVQIRPYVHQCVNVFGYGRLMWGSGWPVCLVASTYKDTLTVVMDNLPHPTSEEIKLLFRTNALKWYALEN